MRQAERNAAKNKTFVYILAGIGAAVIGSAIAIWKIMSWQIEHMFDEDARDFRAWEKEQRGENKE